MPSFDLILSGSAVQIWVVVGLARLMAGGRQWSGRRRVSQSFAKKPSGIAVEGEASWRRATRTLSCGRRSCRGSHGPAGISASMAMNSWWRLHAAPDDLALEHVDHHACSRGSWCQSAGRAGCGRNREHRRPHRATGSFENCRKHGCTELIMAATQWVASAGGSLSVRATTRSATSGPSGGMRDGRVEQTVVALLGERPSARRSPCRSAAIPLVPIKRCAVPCAPNFLGDVKTTTDSAV